MILQFTANNEPSAGLRGELGKIFQMAVSLSQAFQTQNATFTVTLPRVATRESVINFDERTMEDRGGPSSPDGTRRVGVLIFPGLFKTTTGMRTCLVKIRVVCADELLTRKTL